MGKLPAGKADAKTDAKVAALADQAAKLDGKYFNKGDVKLDDGGVIAVKFTSGVNANHGMTLTPTLNSDNGQISQWTCAGDTAKKSGAGKALAANRLPTSCQADAVAAPAGQGGS